MGVTAAESSTYTDFAQINTGGVRPDGSDGVNEVTYLILDVIEEMRLLAAQLLDPGQQEEPRPLHQARGPHHPHRLRPALGLQHRPDRPGAGARRASRVADARNGGTSGCVEVGAFGKENYNLTGYFNMPKVLEITLHNGVDPRTGQQLGPQTGDPRAFETFDELFDGLSRSSSTTSSTSRCGATTSSSGSTPATCPRPSSRC